MARRTRKRRKRGWFKGTLLFVFALLAIWSSTFVVWIYWAEIENFFKSRATAISHQKGQKPSQEKISDEDREKLEEILKRGKP